MPSKKRYINLFGQNNAKRSSNASTATQEMNSVVYTDYSELLDKCRDLYDSLRPLRDKMKRSTDYVFGRQWNDIITDPDGKYFGEQIREEDYIKRQGKVPLKYNVMRKSLKAILGLYRNNKSEPVAIARVRDKQKLGEMMTAMMQYTYQSNDIGELNSRLLENAYCTGVFARSVYYRFNDERKINDAYVQNENVYKMFFNDDLEDPLLRDITIIGAIRDMPIKNLLSVFAHNAQEAQMLANEYGVSPTNMQRSYDSAFVGNAIYEDDFYTPADPNKCRVYEVWTKESEECLYCHDTAKGEEEYRPLSDMRYIEEENARRVAEMEQLGYSADYASLIDYKWKIREFWYVHYLTPNGKCITESETPFDHGSHPFVVGMYPMMNGQVYSPAEELIDIQRVINRTLSQIDFIRQNGAKNLLMVPYDAIPDNMTPEMFAREYTRGGSMLFYKANPAIPVPQQIRTQSVAPGDIDVVRLYLELNDQIGGVSGALRGEQASNNKPSSLYAQESQNSANNVADFMTWFYTCIRKSDLKMLQLIAQYTTDKRYIPIAGKTFSEEAKLYVPEKVRNILFDIAVSDMVSTTAYRLSMESFLSEIMRAGLIDLKEFLEVSAAPYADQLLKIIERRSNVDNNMQGLANLSQEQMQQIQQEMNKAVGQQQQVAQQ